MLMKYENGKVQACALFALQEVTILMKLAYRRRFVVCFSGYNVQSCCTAGLDNLPERLRKGSRFLIHGAAGKSCCIWWGLPNIEISSYHGWLNWFDGLRLRKEVKDYLKDGAYHGKILVKVVEIETCEGGSDYHRRLRSGFVSGVEIDYDMIFVARTFFGLEPDKNLVLVKGDVVKAFNEIVSPDPAMSLCKLLESYNMMFIKFDVIVLDKADDDDVFTLPLLLVLRHPLDEDLATMTPQTRSNTGSDDDNREAMRESIAIMMMEDMDKLLAKMRAADVAATASGSGMVVRPHGEPQRGMQYHRVTKIELPRFGGEDVGGWLFRCEQFFKVDNVPGENKRFGIAYDDPLGEIKKLRQTRSVKDYIDAFDKLLCREDLPMEQTMSFFMAGLQHEIELAVKMFKPKTLAELNRLCKLEDTRLGSEATMEISLQISLNAIIGVTNYKTMRVMGWVGKHELYFLINTCSTHNFLDVTTAKNIGCHIKKTFLMKVAIAMSKSLISSTMYSNFTWSLQGEKFTTSAMLLPLGGCEMVLGKEWLSTLGDTSCNFKDLRMSFRYNNKVLTLKGTQKATIQWMEGKQGAKMLESNSMQCCSMYV
nr:hypothetical protein [Tanacetum cinerariifolium]